MSRSEAPARDFEDGLSTSMITEVCRGVPCTEAGGPDASAAG